MVNPAKKAPLVQMEKQDVLVSTGQKVDVDLVGKMENPVPQVLKGNLVSQAPMVPMVQEESKVLKVTKALMVLLVPLVILVPTAKMVFLVTPELEAPAVTLESTVLLGLKVPRERMAMTVYPE